MNNGSSMHSDDSLDASTDNTVREAFNDLNRRAMMIPTDNGPHQARSPKFDRRPGRRTLAPALALAAVAVLGVGTVGVLQLQDDDSAVNVAAESTEDQDGVASQPSETDGDGSETSESAASDDDTSNDDDSAAQAETDDDSVNDSPTSDSGVTAAASGERFRVDSDRIAADVDDPFLNVRLDPGIDGALLAKLPPNYRGLEATGQTEVVSGQTWVEVSLLNPVAFDATVESPSRTPTGWLSGALILPLADGIAVGTDEVPACRGDHVLTAASNNGEFNVTGLESTMITDSCLRVVATLAEGSAGFDWDSSPGAYGVPNIAVVDETFGARIDLGATNTAWPGATDTVNGAYVMRDGDEDLADPACFRSCLDLVVLQPVGTVSTTMLPEIGAVVIDLTLADGEPHNPDSLVHLLGEPQTEPGAIIVEGIARPFEASIGIQIVDEDGEPVAASYKDGATGDFVGEQYGDSTTDWTTAWGYFIFRAEDLPTGDYTLLLDGDGGSDNPDLVEIPFTITE